MKQKIGDLYVLIAVALLVTSVAVAVSLAQPAPYPGAGPTPTPGPTPAPGAGGPAPYPTAGPSPTPPGALPDLVVENVWNVSVNGQVIIHFIIHNNGTAAAGTSTACKVVNGVVVDTDSVPRLGISGRYNGEFAPEPCPPGATFTVTVEADNYHVVAESNERNNNRTETFICPAGPLPGGPDLVVAKTVNVVGDTFVVDYTVTNIGNERAGTSTTCKYVDGVLEEEEGCPRLGPGASYVGEFDPEPCPCGQTLNVTVCADNYNVVVESDETNNCEINIVTCPLPEPEIEVIKTVWDGTAWVDEITAGIGAVVTFNSTIHNGGTCCNLTNVVVWDVLSPSLRYVGVLGATPAPDLIVNYPDGSTELRWFLTGLVLEPCDSETFLIQAVVVDGGVDTNTQHASAMVECTGEFIEGEDSAIVNGVGIPRIDADMTVRDPDTGNWVNGIRVSRGDTVTFRSRIHNDGTCCDLTDIQVADRLPWGFTYLGATLQPWDLAVWPWGTGLGWFIPGPLEPDDTITIRITATADQIGVYPNIYHEAHAWAECRQTIVESDRENVVVAVVNRPRIEVVKVAVPGAGPACTDVTFTITVTNTGGWRLNPVTVVDTLPEGMSYVASIPAPAVPVVDNTITWDVGPMAPTAVEVITLVAHIDAGPIANMAPCVAGWPLLNEVTARGMHAAPGYGPVRNTDTELVCRTP